MGRAIDRVICPRQTIFGTKPCAHILDLLVAQLLLLRRWCWCCLVFLLPVEHLIQHIAQVGSSRSRRSGGLLRLIVARCRTGLLLRLALLRLILRLACIVPDRRVLLLWRLILLVLLLLFPANRIQNAADSTLGLSVRRLAGSADLIFLTENGTQDSGGQLGWILC